MSTKNTISIREAVFVPTYKRSAFLYCCLEAIRAAEPTIEIYVAPDRGLDESEVCASFDAQQLETHDHPYHGNSYNMLEGLKTLYALGYDRVFVVEDDCIIDPTFFDWARNALDNPKPWNPDPFAASGWEFSPDAPKEDGPDVICDWYLSVCSAIPRKSLEKIIEHAKPEYYRDMKGYQAANFDKIRFLQGGIHYEQDGLILGIACQNGQRITWPRRPRAQHIGWHGYHMLHGKVPQGDLSKQVAVVKMAIANPDIMRNLMNGGEPPEAVGCMGCGKNLVTTNSKAETICVSCFHKTHPELPQTTQSHYYVKSLTASYA